LKSDLKTKNRNSAIGNSTARGFNFFANPLCTLRDALGFNKTILRTLQHISNPLTSQPTHQRFAKELQFPDAIFGL
jgi:hypothetical protein